MLPNNWTTKRIVLVWTKDKSWENVELRPVCSLEKKVNQRVYILVLTLAKTELHDMK